MSIVLFKLKELLFKTLLTNWQCHSNWNHKVYEIVMRNLNQAKSTPTGDVIPLL